MHRWHAADSREAQAQALAVNIGDWLARTVRRDGAAGLRVSGGRSPVALFECLAALELPWDRVRVGLVDERLVAPGDAHSNATLVRRHLLRGASGAAVFDDLLEPGLDLDGCVARANARAPRPGPATLTVLGMGDDGHTASWFADAPELEQAFDPARDAPYLALHPRSAPYARISLSLRAVLDSACLALLLDGDVKRAVFERAAADSASTLPVARILHQNKVELDVHWAA